MITEVKPQFDVEAEIRDLEARKERLAHLLKLRAEVSVLECKMNIAQESDIEKIAMRTVTNYFNVTEELILSRNRHAEVAEARHAVMYLIRALTNKTFAEIGRKFDRDHGTVVYAVRGVEERMGVDPKFLSEISGLSETCRKALDALKQPS